jgi:hypothetical protein
VSANSTAPATLTIHTSKNDCNSSSIRHSTRYSFVKIGTRSFLSSGKASTPCRTVPTSFAAAFAGFLLLGIRRRRARPRASLTILLLFVGAIGLSIGCGGSGSSPDDVAKGTYTLTLDGTDTSNSSIAASTTLTLTVH